MMAMPRISFLLLRNLLALVSLCLAACLLPAGVAFANQADISVSFRHGDVEIDAQLPFELNAELRDAAERGVPLYFSVDLEVDRKRWWWFDATEIESRITWRVLYNALTRQWRVGTGDLSLPVAGLEDAMDVVRTIRGWPVAKLSDLSAGVRYEGRLRLRLDTSRLSRPFQINAFNSSAWTASSPWYEFSFKVPDTVAEGP